MSNEYDVVILGGGTGGYVAAIKAAQLGKKVAIVEKEKLGGTCLHKGCIPSKALLRSAQVYKTMKRGTEFGVETSNLRFNWLTAQERKNKIVEQLHQGILHLMKKAKIDVFYGTGGLLGPSIFSPQAGTISIEKEEAADGELLIPRAVVIATGSRPRTLPFLPIDNKYVITSDDALTLEEIPTSIIIVGGGVIGVEWASLLADIGVEVTIVEAGTRILPAEDEDVSKEMTRYLIKQGITIITDGTILEDITKKEDTIVLSVQQKDTIHTIEANKVLTAIGRQANVENIGLENTSIELKNGFIDVSPFLQTKESHIYAIGDVIGGMQLAHVASQEGIIAISHLFGEEVTPLQDDRIPRCIYSALEVGAVGLTEEEAKHAGYDIQIGKFPLKANGKALVYGESNGFIKIIADKNTNDLLGVHIVGAHATELISQSVLAKVLQASPWEITQAVHPHPTIGEGVFEAALHLEGKAIHM